MQYEYKVIPAPRRGLKGKGIKGAEARFAYAIQTLMNQFAADGWEFQRAETLGSEERHGLTSAQTVYRDLLVFRRLRPADQAPVNPEPLDLTPAAHPTDQPDPDEDEEDDPIEAPLARRARPVRDHAPRLSGARKRAGGDVPPAAGRSRIYPSKST
ncbi:MAG: DUF4177 domain-containing protein [Paracoccaceae bacterium]